MKLYLVQHGTAKREQEDPERGLTEKGLKDVEKVASFAAGLDLRVGSIFHSSKKRAKQTAEVLARYLKPEKGVSESEGLKPLDEPRIWAERLSSEEKDIMLVGHLPHLARLASLLLSGDGEKAIVSFKNGGIVCLESDDSGWSIEWMVVPELFG